MPQAVSGEVKNQNPALPALRYDLEVTRSTACEAMRENMETTGVKGHRGLGP